MGDLEHVRGDDLAEIAPARRAPPRRRPRDRPGRGRRAPRSRPAAPATRRSRSDRAGAPMRSPPAAEPTNGPSGRDARAPPSAVARDLGRGDAAPARRASTSRRYSRVVPVVAARPERADLEPLEDPEQAVQVIGVGVGERHDVDAADAAGAQERLDDARARVEERRRARRRRRPASPRRPGASTTAASPCPTSRKVTTSVARVAPPEVADRQAAGGDQRGGERRDRGQPPRPARGPPGRARARPPAAVSAAVSSTFGRAADPERRVRAKGLRDGERRARRPAGERPAPASRAAPQSAPSVAPASPTGTTTSSTSGTSARLPSAASGRHLAEVVRHERRGRGGRRRGGGAEAPQPAQASAGAEGCGRVRAPGPMRRARSAIPATDASDSCSDTSAELQRVARRAARAPPPRSPGPGEAGLPNRNAPIPIASMSAERSVATASPVSSVKKPMAGSAAAAATARGSTQSASLGTRTAAARTARKKKRRHRRQVQPRHRQHVGRPGGPEALLDVVGDAAPIAEHGGLAGTRPARRRPRGRPRPEARAGRRRRPGAGRRRSARRAAGWRPGRARPRARRCPPRAGPASDRAARDSACRAGSAAARGRR